MPASLKILNKLFLEKEKEIEDDIKEVQKLTTKFKVREIERTESNYKYFESIFGIKKMWHEIISLLPSLDDSTIIRLYASKMNGNDKLLEIYKKYQKTRKQQKIKQKAIFPKGDVRIPKYKQFEEIKISYKSLKNKAEWGLIGDIFFIQYVKSKDSKGFLIKDKILALTFSQVFDQLWNNTNKYTSIAKH